MRKFTKSILALAALFIAVGANAKTEKVHATFEGTYATDQATWDGDSKTMTWKATWSNQIKSIGLPKGDISKYKKLVVDIDIKSGEQIRVLFYKGGSNKTLYASNGVNVFVLADTLKSLYPNDYNEYLLACDEICLSGNNNVSPGEAVINDVYLETYDDEGEKVFATFEGTYATDQATWDGDSKTMTWKATWSNQIKSIGLPKGDISKYKKLVVDIDIKSGEQIRVLFYKGGSNKTLYASNGVNVFVLADTLKSLYPNDYNEYLLACDEICLSGNNNVSPGEAVINSVYLETYPENESVEIPDIKYEEDPGKPAGNYVDFTEAFPALSQYIGLDNESHSIVLGNGANIVGSRYNHTVMADLSAYSKITFVTSPNLKLSLYMNHEIDSKNGAGDYGEGDVGKYVYMDLQANENGIIEVDLTGYYKRELNCIALPWDNNNKGTVWYILLTEATGADVTIGSSGYATFCYSKHVEIPDGVEAFAAQVQGNKVILNKVDVVPSNNAVILKAAAGNYSLPFAVSASAIANNDLLVSSGSTTGDGTIYVLANGDNGVGFYKLANGEKVPAGKGYLVIDSNAPEFLGFGGDATGINEVKAVEAKGEFFNLAGQRVAKPAKGLYIANGKKVIIK